MNRRYSKKREQILHLLKAEQGILSARDIQSKLPGLDITTIYRNLDLFVGEGNIKKVFLDNSKEILYEYQKEPHHHAVCSECERVIHFSVPSKEIKKLLGIDDFKISNIDLTIKGVCTKKS